MSQSQSILTDWDAEKTAAMGKHAVVAHHNLHERPMFSDAGLAKLLDEYPRDQLGIWTDRAMNGEERAFRNGRADSLSGAELLESVANGQLWLNVRAANSALDAYADLSEELFGALEAVNPGLKTFKRDVGVLISSPNMHVHYHLDVPLVSLWQIRGTKRFWVYPADAPFATDREIEAVVLKETSEEIHYEPAFDDHAMVVDLEPGMMSTWPQNAPHRIDNHGMLNVSLSCEFMTMPALVRANAIYANGVFRRRFGWSPSIARDGSLSRLTKAGAARGFKAFMGRKAFARQIPVTFVVDPTVEGAVRDVIPAT